MRHSRVAQRPHQRRVGCQVEVDLVHGRWNGGRDRSAKARLNAAVHVPADDAFHVGMASDDGFQFPRRFAGLWSMLLISVRNGGWCMAITTGAMALSALLPAIRGVGCARCAHGRLRRHRVERDQLCADRHAVLNEIAVA